MDLFGAARRKIGNAIAGNHEESGQPATIPSSPSASEKGQEAQQGSKLSEAQTLEQTGVIPAPGQTMPWNSSRTPPPVSYDVAMTPEQLKARRIAQIENADIGQSKHVRFFIFLVSCWLFIGPPWYVVLTTSEVGWALSRRSFTWGDQTSVNFYAGALFIELGMMFSTFFLAYLRQMQADQEGRNRLVNRAVRGLTGVWFALAAISAYGQFYYLFNASTVAPDRFHVVFVASRVIAFTVVDFATAFYLSRIQSTLDELMETGRKKAKYHRDMAQVDVEVLQKQAEADMTVEQARNDMEDKRRKNEIANRVITTMAEAGLRVIEAKFQSPTPELPPSNTNGTTIVEQDAQTPSSKDQTP
ncbi:MAG TPA: hypothetical protein DHW02_12860 [Ktedonobacter sp.]|nr:hypothetical protein [Ktedonobacter sp.]